MTAVRSVVLAGASGLVGGLVLARLLSDPAGPVVMAPVRRPLGNATPRLPDLLSNLADPAVDVELALRMREAGPPPDAFLCCLGTTIRKAGSQEAFLAVDRDLVLRLAAMARSAGARQAILVSSVGASAQSGNFYLRVKGETERALVDLGFARVDLLRPGLLLGERSESRPAESLGRALAPLTNRLMPGGLRRYRAIPAQTVAAAAVALLGSGPDGRFVHEYDALVALAGGA